MGAVPPEVRSKDLSQLDHQLPTTEEDYLFRYGRFATKTPSTAANWTLAKWQQTLDLKEFAPNNEVDVEDWFNECSPKIVAHDVTAKIFLQLLNLVASEAMRPLMRTIFIYEAEMIYLCDVADVIVLRRFPHMFEVQQVEMTLLNPRRQATVLTAAMKYKMTIQQYQHMCDRRGRSLILGEHQLKEVFLKTLPLIIHRELIKDVKILADDVESVIQKATYIEGYQNVFAISDEHWVDEPQEIYAVAPVKQPPGKCKSCGAAAGAHYRKNCPYNNYKCLTCGRPGHISAACENKVVTDTAGKKRIVIEEKRTGANIKTNVDNTEPDQLETMSKVVGKILKRGEEVREKARKKYAKEREEDARETGEIYKKPPPPRKVLYEEEDSAEEPELETPDENDDFDATIAYLDIFCEGIDKPVNAMKHMRVLCSVNGQETDVLLDVGAAGCCMSKLDAERLKIEINESIPPRQCRGIGQGVMMATVSHPVPVEIGERVAYPEFSILDNDIPILLSKSVLGELQLLLDPGNDAIYLDGKMIECFHAASIDPVTPSVVQQFTHGPIEEAILKKVKETRLESELTADEAKELADVIRELSPLWFAPEAAKCTLIEMDLPVRGKPHRQRGYPIPGHLKEEMYKQIDDLLAQKLINYEPDCPWVSPCCLVPKPHSNPVKWRLVVDYRWINTQIQDDGYQLPLIQELLGSLSNSKYFTVIDLNWGFWNVRLTPEARQYTGFCVPGRGVFTWNVTPFGLKVSPTNFQRAMELTLQDPIDDGECRVYLDDIVVLGNTVKENLTRVRRLGGLLRDGGFFFNFEKFKPLRIRTVILGHQISLNSIAADPAKVQGLIEATAPRTKPELRSFLAAANYLRNFVQDFSTVVAPLTDMLKKDVRVIWGEEQQLAFENLKAALIERTSLSMPDFSKDFIIFTDASQVGVGAALCQLTDDREDLVFICLASKKFDKTQKNWSTSERELFAIVWACEHYDMYIKGRRPLIFSDHKSLEYLVTVQAPKLQRWAMRLTEYRPYVGYIKGNDNNVADWLSRAFPADDERVTTRMYAPETLISYNFVDHNEFTLPTPEEMRTEAMMDNIKLPSGYLKFEAQTGYVAHNGKLYIPVRFRQRVLMWFHASVYGGHQGVNRTVNRLKRYVGWPNLQQDVEEFIRQCPVCNTIKPVKSLPGTIGALNNPHLFHMISMDLFGPRKYHGQYVHVLVIIDHFSRFMVTAPMLQATTEEVINALVTRWLPYFGVPRSILTDNGSQFVSKEFVQHMTSRWNVKLANTFVEYPQGNGINESSHRILETAIKTTPFRHFSELNEVLAYANALYNATPNRMTGNSPSAIVYGKDMALPGLERFSEDAPDSVRLAFMREYRGINMLLKQAERINQEAEEAAKERKGPPSIKAGDIVTYRLKQSERKKAVHLTGEISYQPDRSLPQRVIKVSKSGLMVRPMWTNGPDRECPLTEAKLIASNIPEKLRQQVKELYPTLAWKKDYELVGGETELAKIGSEFDARRAKRPRPAVEINTYSGDNPR